MNNSQTRTELPVVVIGAGPVGLAAAAHLMERGLRPLVLEAGASAAAAVRQWGHVRIFSPWRYNIDAAARRLLKSTGWVEPEAEELPTGSELVERYLEPLARHPRLASHVRYDLRVSAVTRQNMDKVKTAGRAERPFLVRATRGHGGVVQEFLARAVIDASGTWGRPNPAGAGGLPATGETEHRDLLDYGIPDVLGRERERFADRHVLVVGAGHSAMNSILDLLTLRETAPATRITWVMRRADPSTAYGGGAADALPARGRLGARAEEAVRSGALRLLTPFRISRFATTASGTLRVSGELDGGIQPALEVDRVIVAAGFRPDIEMLREVRVKLDPWLESVEALAPLIDPNEHSCGTVRPHGARELAHPEPDFYIVGMKSYGRAPTFLMATGYEQVRSVVAQLVGDHAAAARVELDLPETGVCSTRPRMSEPAEGKTEAAAAAEGGCCGGEPTPGADACCKLDEEKKAAGESGCGCGGKSAAEPEREPAAACCG